MIDQEIHPNPNLGWRIWRWKRGRFQSPIMRVIWPEDGIYSAPEGLSGQSGIYALYLPVNWRNMNWRSVKEFVHASAGPQGEIYVDGVVECWGEVVCGERGWRAEHARILAVRAPVTALASALEIGFEIERVYPTVAVYYDD